MEIINEHNVKIKTDKDFIKRADQSYLEQQLEADSQKRAQIQDAIALADISTKPRLIRRHQWLTAHYLTIKAELADRSARPVQSSVVVEAEGVVNRYLKKLIQGGRK